MRRTSLEDWVVLEIVVSALSSWWVSDWDSTF